MTVIDVDIEKKKIYLNVPIIVDNVDTNLTGISIQHKIFWPPDWLAREKSLEASAFRRKSSHKDMV
jgi:hypothetical protein